MHNITKEISFMGFDFTLEIRADERTIISSDVENRTELRYLVSKLGIGLTFQMWKDRKGYHAWAMVSHGSEAAQGLRILGFPIPYPQEEQDIVNINYVSKLLGLSEQDIVNISTLLS